MFSVHHVQYSELEDERRCAPPYINGAVGNVGGAHVDFQCTRAHSRGQANKAKPRRNSLHEIEHNRTGDPAPLKACGVST